jgi:hypothetical protein
MHHLLAAGIAAGERAFGMRDRGDASAAVISSFNQSRFHHSLL